MLTKPRTDHDPFGDAFGELEIVASYHHPFLGGRITIGVRRMVVPSGDNRLEEDVIVTGDEEPCSTT